jgi:hypothetical protein
MDLKDGIIKAKINGGVTSVISENGREIKN